jgi:hypothetical protein
LACAAIGVLSARRRAWSYLRVSAEAGWVAVCNWPRTEARIDLASVTSVSVSGTALVLADVASVVAIRSDAWDRDPGLLEALARLLPHAVATDAGGREVLEEMRDGGASAETVAAARAQRLRSVLLWSLLGIVVMVGLELWV